MSERIEKVKTHFRENKVTYIASSCALAVGVIGTLVIVRKLDTDIVAKNQIASLITWKPRQEINQVRLDLPERSTPSKPLFDTVNNKPYASINEAVRETGRTRASILEDPAIELLKVAA